MITKPRLITLLDTSICNANLGNQIIIQSIERELKSLFPSDFTMRLQYSELFGKQSISYLRKSAYAFFGGTNSLSSEMNKYSQMGFRIRNTFSFSGLVLLGLGWWQYQGAPNAYTRILLTRLLSSTIKHSIRDQYTCNMLSSIGIDNTLNTSCPTVWRLTEDHCTSISHSRSQSVVATVTDYNCSVDDDLRMLKILLEQYENVFVWLQGLDDFSYLKNLNVLVNNKLHLVPPSLRSYERLLETRDLDYIGTRLHAGIKAIQHGKRALILGVDNRAREIAKDINLNVAPRGDDDSINKFIASPYITSLKIPLSAIHAWRAQFADRSIDESIERILS